MYLIIDTDFGDDIDDAFALAYLLKRAKADIQLVLSAFGDTAKRAELICDFLHRVGCPEVPVAAGVKTSDDDPAQYPFLSRHDYPYDPDGLAAVARLIREAEEPVTIVALGPATNLAALMAAYPDCREKVHIVSMFGSVRQGYFGSSDPINEYNVVMDIPAGTAFLAAGWDVSLTPLDTCGQLFIRGEEYRRLLCGSNPVLRALMEEFTRWMSLGRFNGPAEDKGASTSCLFDTVAAYMAFDTPLLKWETLPLAVDEKGYTVITPGAPPARCATDWVDKEAFLHHLCDVYVSE